jgi:hypothetical protein
MIIMMKWKILVVFGMKVCVTMYSKKQIFIFWKDLLNKSLIKKLSDKYFNKGDQFFKI